MRQLQKKTIASSVYMFHMLPSFNHIIYKTLLLLLLLLTSSPTNTTLAIHINTAAPFLSSVHNVVQRIMGQTISATQFFVYGKRHFTQYVIVT